MLGLIANILFKYHIYYGSSDRAERGVGFRLCYTVGSVKRPSLCVENKEHLLFVIQHHQKLDGSIKEIDGSVKQ